MEHWNVESGEVWLRRATAPQIEQRPSTVWLNPTPKDYWNYAQSTAMIREIMGERMLFGLGDAMKEVVRREVKFTIDNNLITFYSSNGLSQSLR